MAPALLFPFLVISALSSDISKDSSAPAYTIDLSWAESGDLALHLVTERGAIERHVYPYRTSRREHSQDMFLLWILDAFKTIFFHPYFSETALDYSTRSAEIHREFGESMDRFAHIVKHTQELIQAYRSLFRGLTEHLAERFDGHLFYNIDGNDMFEGLYQEVRKRIPGLAFYENGNSGWNSAQRTWGESSGFTIDILLKYMADRKIRHLYSVNMLYITHLLKTDRVFPLALFHALGLEWVCIDYDTYDHLSFSVLQKSAFNGPAFRRFSCQPNVASLTDELFGIRNTIYFPLADFHRADRILPQGSPENAVVISQARVHAVSKSLPETLFYLENTLAEDVYHDFQILYYALAHLALNDKNLSKENKTRFFCRFSNIYLTVLSFLKYEVIEGLIDEGIETHIYGDTSWETIFPNAYQKKFLAEREIQETFDWQHSVYVLMNQTYSYFENNPVFRRAVNLGVSYLCFPPVVRTTDLEGMSLLEYRNNSELCKKFREIRQLTQDSRYEESRKTLLRKNGECRENFYAQVIGAPSADVFGSVWRHHFKLLLGQLQDYLKVHHERVFRVYDALTAPAPFQFPIESSRFASRRFFKALSRIAISA